ncbi:MAG TPA: hypothetical protein PLC40_20770, partial [Candidatus Hydrogenedentes bacterium]|nr:hypothetical protein [Candidatus Hydrogenedentota bacterium]
KERRSGILPLCIKTDIRAVVTMGAAACRFYDLRRSLRADLGCKYQVAYEGMSQTVNVHTLTALILLVKMYAPFFPLPVTVFSASPA